MQKDFALCADEIRRGLTADEQQMDYPDQAPQWDKPISFGATNVIPFPVGCLPPEMRDYVEQLVESTQTPTEMAGILSLGILSTAYQRDYTVQITSDWGEPLCLYLIAVAPPGERKSAVISALTAPVYDYEALEQEKNAAEIARNREERVLLEKAIKVAETEAAKGGSDAAVMRRQALDLAVELDAHEELHPLRLLADDTTQEKLIDIMDEQGGSITVCSSEGGVFGIMRGRYSSSANMDIYLKGHAGDPVSVDRITRKANHIPAPRLSMILTIQPIVLQGLMDDATFRGRGLCGRFLYAVCQSKVGQRQVAPEPITDEVRTAYQQFVHRILGHEGTGVVTLSVEADELRKDYQAKIEEKLGGEWAHIKEWGGKLVGAMLRIAALLHLSSYPAEMPIQPDAMAKAIRIADFLGCHAELAYQMMGSDGAVGEAENLWRRIKAATGDKISKRDLYRQLRGGKYKHIEDIETPLKILEEYGYIQIEYDTKNTSGRKASPIIIINPLAD